jgi:hypothetical protein
MFVKRMTDEQEAALYSTAAQVRDMLDVTGLPWCLSHGSLLGAWRHHGIIPWDDDLDFWFPRDHTRILEYEVKKRGWSYARLSPFLAKIWDDRQAIHQSYPNHPWKWPFCDITLYDVISQNTVLIEWGRHTRFAPFHRDKLLPTQLCPFGPLILPVPNCPEIFLGAIYPEWNTRPTSSDRSHIYGRMYDEPSERIPIKELVMKFPLFNVGLAIPLI